jgi:hypothetical protein
MKLNFNGSMLDYIFNFIKLLKKKMQTYKLDSVPDKSEPSFI